MSSRSAILAVARRLSDLRRNMAQQDRGDPRRIGVVALRAVRDQVSTRAVDRQAAPQSHRQRVEHILDLIKNHAAP